MRELVDICSWQYMLIFITRDYSSTIVILNLDSSFRSMRYENIIDRGEFFTFLENFIRIFQVDYLLHTLIFKYRRFIYS